MIRPRDIAAVITACGLAMGGVTIGAAASDAAASGTSTGTAPQQLVHAYPLGPRRLCCNGQTGLNGHSGSSARTAAGANAGVVPARGPTRGGGGPTGGASAGVSAGLLIAFGALAALVAAGATAVCRARRQAARFPRASHQRAMAYSNGAASTASLAGENGKPGAGSSWDGRRSPPAAVSEVDEREYRRLDEVGHAGGAFNHGVVLHERGDVNGAKAAYERAERRGDPDAAFNLGVLLYEAGDLDGAEAAWQRGAGDGHVRAAANLVFLSRHRRELEPGRMARSEAPGGAQFDELSQRPAEDSVALTGAFNLGVVLDQQGDVPGAIVAYRRAERLGDPDAAFNLGVLLYEAGDLDGAEAAWRRSAGRGHPRGAGNLEFLLRRRAELKTAAVADNEGEEK
jgi:Flp pilus assembly protein TadD